CYYLSSIFRDIVIQRFDKFPMLNLFGPKGAGKNACAESLLYFFGRKQKIPNLHNTSNPALADHVATSANAICILDEYRNDLEMEKREFLKGLWDGTGRTRMNMDKDKKKETTSVDQAVIVCGQQMATADIALFSRFIVASFTQTEYSETEKKDFEGLEAINKRGLTHITHLILKTRSFFKSNYCKKAEALNLKFKDLLKGQTIETRILNNWLSVLGAYYTLTDEIDIPWDEDDTCQLAVNLMLIQNSETKKNDDLGNFWKAIQYLISSNILFDGGDYKYAYANFTSRKHQINSKWITTKFEYISPKNIFYLSVSRVFSLYKTQTLREGDKPLPDSTVEYYLKNCPAFLFSTKKESFKKIDPKSGIQEESDGKKKYTSTSALVFDLDLLDITIPLTEDDSAVPAAVETTENPNENSGPIVTDKPDDLQF
ncbi:MAG: hypothetical protein HQ541_14845, partial [Mariniphaga sp.]|nr:hypothetical protein [Mariniphaga sp.]